MYSVAISNKLIREAVPTDSKSSLVFLPMEFRVKYLLISLIQKETFEFEAIDITTPMFSEYFGLSWGGIQTKSLKNAIENLIESRYIIDGVVVKWLSDESYFADGNIHLKLDDSLSPYLLQLKGNFTLYTYDAVSKFKSRYSYRIYEFLKSAEGMGFYKISLSDAISLLGDNCCKTKNEFIKRVLSPALNDINTCSDLRIKRRFYKPFGKPEQIWFSIRNKDDDTPSENIKYCDNLTSTSKETDISDELLMPVDIEIDDKMRALIDSVKLD
ncbi:MAG: replication initiation protein [Clostridia bacterium]|nr:replication initiation protein [Clostridia bacterium]